MTTLPYPDILIMLEDKMNALPEFVGMRKIPRLSRTCVITEKLDGTSGCIVIASDSQPFECADGRVVPFLVGCRTRWIFPEADNHNFAKFAYEHAEELLKLGPGRHFGEYWGSGINRGYGKTKGEKVFSLFDTDKWNEANPAPACCSVVPVLYTGLFTTDAVEACLELLKLGSVAAPGFMKPEGIVCRHIQGSLYFKKTLEGDEYWKTREEPEEPKATKPPRQAPKKLEPLGHSPAVQVSF